MKHLNTLLLSAALALAPFTLSALELKESASLAKDVAAGKLPPVAERAPEEPLIVDLPAKGREFGKQGGELRTMFTRAKDIRYMVVYGYARLVGYDHNYELKPDILRAVDVEEGRIFTFHLRKGHKWSDGRPFTTEDIRYWWEDVANNPELAPSGPPELMLVNGQPAKVEVIDETTIRFEWPAPNPRFLPALAQARPPFIYRPSHYMKPFHSKYADPATLEPLLAKMKVRNWAQLHNKFDNMYQNDNPDLPTIDSVEVAIAAGGLVASKVTLGEVDLQARSLTFSDMPVLKKGEATGNYRTFVWANGAAAEIALYPNLNYYDPAYRELMRDVRFRRALSLAVDRKTINKSLYFGLAKERGVAVLEQSPFYNEEHAYAWADYDPEQASALLDEVGLDKRDSDGYRLKLIYRPLDRDILRNSAYQGDSMMPVWFGWNNGLPTAEASPEQLAPVDQTNFSWPMWGQYFQTKGAAGEPPDMDAPKRLMELFDAWNAAATDEERAAVWREMLAIHADQVFAIGLVAQAPQPVVVANNLHNVPEQAVYAWDPGGHLGVHRPDEFFFAD
jgi:peptide/nickel transport system substrate-binding protein